MSRMWMIRAGEGAYLIDEFDNLSIISIGWNQVGNLKKLQNKEAIRQALISHFPEDKPGRVSLITGQLYRFAYEIKQGDDVITYDPESRVYLIGKAVSDYTYKVIDKHPHQHIISVKWTGEKSRDDLSVEARNYLGAIMSLFEVVGNTRDELLSKTVERLVDEEAQETTEDEIKAAVVENAHEFIKDKILKLNWEEMQELVAGILRGMGYKTRIAAKGPDRGCDVFASPDGLGLEEPRIKVEVKHRNGSMGADMVRSFTGGLRTGDKGLYVSTGGFSKEAKYEADRSSIPLTLIDSDELVRLIVQYYDNFDTDTKALIPLKKIYWPV